MINTIIKPVTFEINGNKYEVHKLAPLDNFNFFKKVMSYLGSSFSDFSGIVKGKFSESAEVDLKSLADAVHKIFIALHVNDSEGVIIVESLNQTVRNNRKIDANNINVIFADDAGEMLEASIRSMVIHFKPFLSVLSSGAVGLVQAGTKQTTENSVTI